MKKFNTLTTTAVPLLMNHVDTDQIIPARFLKTTVKTGIGDNLFRDWRYNEQNEEIEDFILNQDNQNGEILVAGENFGCGSSREHAVWSLADYGFRAVIAKSFADIFKNNSLNNGLLPIQVSDEFWEEIAAASKNKKQEIKIDLPAQTVTVNGKTEQFEIDHFRKECILNGYTDLDYLVSIKDEINEFIKQHPVPEITF